jgi:hypothetical protein
MKNQKMTAVLLAATLVFTMACGVVQSVIGGGNGSAATELWTDVPKLDGATKTEAQIPAWMNLLISQSTGGKFDFVVYKTTKSADDIKSFYTTERMQGQGWDVGSPGCQVITTNSESGGGGAGFCTFTRAESGRQSVLLIFPTPASTGSEGQVYYIRAVLPPTPQP